VARNHNENVAHTIKAVTEIRACNKICREFDAREIADVLTIRNHCFQQVELNDTTQANVTSRARKLQRQRRSPGTSADNRYCLGSCVAY
jgi:hypothetical protein